MVISALAGQKSNQSMWNASRIIAAGQESNRSISKVLQKVSRMVHLYSVIMLVCATHQMECAAVVTISMLIIVRLSHFNYWV